VNRAENITLYWVTTLLAKVSSFPGEFVFSNKQKTSAYTG
jgi:hypothetical protein